MKLTLKQKVFSVKEKFEVMDENGMPVYEVVGKIFSWGHKLAVSDLVSNVVLNVQQKVLSFMPKYFISREGQEEMELKGHFSLLHPHYTLKTANGDWEVRGDFIQHEYEMRKGDELLASVCKQWFAWGDTYLLDVQKNENVLTALGIMLAIDCVNADTNSLQTSSYN